jgi:hypothetical protein
MPAEQGALRLGETGAHSLPQPCPRSGERDVTALPIDREHATEDLIGLDRRVREVRPVASKRHTADAAIGGSFDPDHAVGDDPFAEAIEHDIARLDR